MLNIKDFLQQNNIPYRAFGKNVARGNINIQCPFCTNDPDYHLGINLKSNVWGCWRDTAHRGKSPVRLIQKLVGCSHSEAQDICEITTFKIDSFVDFIPFRQNIEEASNKVYTIDELLDTENFEGKYSQKRFINYLQTRGYSLEIINDMIGRFNMRYCYKGKLENRLVVPLYQNKQVVNYVARSIDRHGVRYLTAANPPEYAKTTNILFDYDNLKKYNDTLFVCEGVFDALKIIYEVGKSATCVFTKNISEIQEQKLYEVAKYYNKVLLLFDKTEVLNTLKIERGLSHIKNIKTITHLLEVKDPGSMSSRQVKKLLRKVIAF